MSEELAGCCFFAKRAREESESVPPAAAVLLGGAAKEPGMLGPEQIRKRDSQVFVGVGRLCINRFHGSQAVAQSYLLVRRDGHA